MQFKRASERCNFNTFFEDEEQIQSMPIATSVWFTDLILVKSSLTPVLNHKKCNLGNHLFCYSGLFSAGRGQ